MSGDITTPSDRRDEVRNVHVVARRSESMELTHSLVADAAAAYRAEEPLYDVEREQIETLPDAFATGRFGRRDAEWVMRWYYRRFLGAYPDDERRAAEERFEENDAQTVRAAVSDAATAADTGEAVETLTRLSGVDVPVASAFLLFADPERNVVVGEREWTILREVEVLRDPYPDPPSDAEYETYLGACRSLADQFDCDTWTLYTALWRIWKDRHG